MVAAGEDARMLVTSVGMNTTWGAMMTETDINKEMLGSTPMWLCLPQGEKPPLFLASFPAMF